MHRIEFKTEKNFSCSKRFRFFYWQPLRFILFATFFVFAVDLFLQRKFFNSLFFSHAVLTAFESVLNKPRIKNNTQTRIVGERNALHAYSTQRIVVLNATLLYVYRTTKSTGTAETEQMHVQLEWLEKE